MVELSISDDLDRVIWQDVATGKFDGALEVLIGVMMNASYKVCVKIWDFHRK